MLPPMSEERPTQEPESARRALPLARLAVLVLLGALFLVLGGSRADAAEAEPAPADGPGLLGGTLAAVDAGPELTRVGSTLDAVVDPVLTGAQPVVEPVVGPVVEPVVTPLRPVVERVAAPVAPLPVAELVAPLAAPASGSERPATKAHSAAAERGVDRPTGPGTATVDQSDAASGATSQAVTETSSEAPGHGTPVSRSTASAIDGSTGTPVPYAVLLTAFAAVLLLAGGVAPRRVAPPLAPSFLPPVFPG